jgi:hypothetical protein
MYFPASQLQTDLHTNGGEYILSTTGEDYKGYFYKVNNGKSYTGKNPTDGFNILLIIPQTSPNTNDVPIETIITIPDPSYKNTSPTRNIPAPYPPQLTPTDIQQGVFTRYFSKKNNELRYMEINKATFQSIMSKNPQMAWDLYSAASLTWYIKGDREKVYTINESLVGHLETTNKWWGFSQYFKNNFSKYYIES